MQNLEFLNLKCVTYTQSGSALTSKFLFLFSNPFTTEHLNTYQTCFKNSPMSDVYAPIHWLHIVLLNFAPSAQPLLTDPFPAMVREFGINYQNISNVLDQ